MKIRSLLFALSTLALTAPALAQEASDAPQQYEMQELPKAYNVPVNPADEASSKDGGRLMEESDYVWYSRHFYIPVDEDGDGTTDYDSARINLPMPTVFTGGPEVRGFGQIFAPGMIYQLFGSLANDTTNLIVPEKVYYEQFKGAGSFTIDSIRMSWFKNPNAGTPIAGAKFYVFRSPSGVVDKTYFTSTAQNSFRNIGARWDRDDLPVAFEADISPEGIDTTLNGNFINQTRMIFEQPLTFAAGTFAIPLIINDEGDALPSGSIGGPSDVRDFQIMVASWARRRAITIGFGPGNEWKTMGLTVFRPGGLFATDRDTILSINRAIIYRIPTDTSRYPAVQDMWFAIFGKVDLNAGVQYHFGREASTQGLGAPTPNPATSATRLPFSLTEVSEVTIDLFDVNGNHLRQLVQSRYVPGHYTIALPIDELGNGTYVARMVAGNNVYSMKVNVAK